MANIKSQKKRIKTNEKRRLRNQSVRARVKTYIRRVEEALAEGNTDAAVDAYRVAERELDKAAGKGAVPRNYAARHKGRLTKKITSSG